MEKLYSLIIKEISYLAVFIDFIFSPEYKAALLTCLIGFGLLYLYDHPTLVIKYCNLLCRMGEFVIASVIMFL